MHYKCPAVLQPDQLLGSPPCSRLQTDAARSLPGTAVTCPGGISAAESSNQVQSCWLPAAAVLELGQHKDVACSGSNHWSHT